MKLTREKALELHRQMWSDMKKILGDCPTPDQRETFKSFWCVNYSSLNSFKNIPRCNCFLCEYTKQAGVDCHKCPIDWGPKVGCMNNEIDYRYTPISKILERPEREWKNE